MNCENPICLQSITEGNLIPLKLLGIDMKTGQQKHITMLVSVCNDCIQKHKYEEKVKGSIKIIS